MENLELVTAPNCHECDEVLEFVKGQNYEVKHTALTTEEVEESQIFVFPALKKETAIVAYGTDIINYIKSL